MPNERLVRDLAVRLHERDINTVPPFDAKETTAENAGLWVTDEVRKAGVLSDGGRPGAVTARVGPANSVTFRP